MWKAFFGRVLRSVWLRKLEFLCAVWSVRVSPSRIVSGIGEVKSVPDIVLFSAWKNDGND